MLLITCPYCGPRAEAEFHGAGEAHLTRPGPAETVSDAEWASYLFLRENPKGIHHERWLHQFGCGRWFVIVRDTLSHEILTQYGMRAPKPEIARP